MENTRTSDIVFNKIKENIVKGEWKPGDKIMSEPQLAKELNVSRVSVREAIEKMVALELLNKRQGGGTFVNNLSPFTHLKSLIPVITLGDQDYREILEFRLIIEVDSACLCAKRCSDELLKELEECYNQMSINRDNHETFVEGDLNFHMKIAEGSGNTLIIKVNEILREILRHHQISLNKTLGPTGGLNEHKLILEAIKKRDSELAGIFMRRHIERTIKDLEKRMENITE